MLIPPTINGIFDKLNFNVMKKLTLSILFLLSGIVVTTAQSLSQNQQDNTDNTSRVIVTVFPNPVIDIVNVLFDKPKGEPIVETFNVNGQRMSPPSNGHGDGSGGVDIDMSALAPGIYIIKVYNGNEVLHVQKIIKN